MRTIQGVRASWLLGALVGSLVVVGAARADVYTERPGFILIFPKVVRDGIRDTTIKLTNTNNLVEHVHCYYVNGTPGRSGAPLCSEVDFDLTLTRQQPTHWTVGAGRGVNPGEPFGSDGSGFDPGLIPPVPTPFTGSLVCFEVDVNGSPVSHNRLKGEAILTTSASGDVSQYNAVAVAAGAQDATASNLDLNNTEYGSCPASYRLEAIPDGSLDPAIETYGAGPSSVVTNLTFVPCTLNLRDGIRGNTTLQFTVWDEFETQVSGGVPESFSCWTSFNIGDVSTMRSSLLPGGGVNTLFANVLIEASSPVVGVAERFSSDTNGNVAAAATNLHVVGAGANSRITLP